MTAGSQDFRLEQRYILRGKLDWSFIKPLADKKEQTKQIH